MENHDGWLAVFGGAVPAQIPVVRSYLGHITWRLMIVIRREIERFALPEIGKTRYAHIY